MEYDEAANRLQSLMSGRRPVGTVSSETFWSYAGEDQVIDARDLRDMINELAKNGECGMRVWGGRGRGRGGG